MEKLYLHQAKIDTVEAPEGQVQGSVDKRLAFFINNFGSRELHRHIRYGILRQCGEIFSDIVGSRLDIFCEIMLHLRCALRAHLWQVIRIALFPRG